MRVFSIIGNCRQKALLMQQIIAHLQGLGFAVSTIKRVSDDVDLDRPSKDTYQQRLAGAQEIVIANSFRSAILHEFRQPQDEPDVDEFFADWSRPTWCCWKAFVSAPIQSWKSLMPGRKGGRFTATMTRSERSSARMAIGRRRPCFPACVASALVRSAPSHSLSWPMP